MLRPHEETLLDHLRDEVVGKAVLPQDLVFALEKDPDLAAWWDRRLRHASAIAHLDRRQVPEDLAGRVVAAAQGGHRQDRAIAGVTNLDKKKAPSELDAVVRRSMEQPFPEHCTESGGHYRAPAELDRRVESEFDDLSAAGARSMTARLGRRPVPDALEGRVAARGMARVLRRPGFGTALTAIALVAVAGWLRFGRVGLPEPGVESVAAAQNPPATAHSSLLPLSFEVVELDLEQAIDQENDVLKLSGFAGSIVEGCQR